MAYPNYSYRSPHQPRPKPVYYWIIGDLGNGQKLIYGYRLSEDEARREAYTNVNVPWYILPLGTRQAARVSQHLRGKNIASGMGVEGALVRMKHRH